MAPMISTDASQYSAVGSYAISLSSGSDGRYNIITEDGFLTITSDESGAPLTVKTAEGVSPNGDGVNDAWVITDIEKFPNNMVSIYNRSGKLVYKMKGYSNSFEGFSNTGSSGRKLLVGPYLYTIDLGDGSRPQKGWIYINY